MANLLVEKRREDCNIEYLPILLLMNGTLASRGGCVGLDLCHGVSLARVLSVLIIRRSSPHQEDFRSSPTMLCTCRILTGLPILHTISHYYLHPDAFTLYTLTGTNSILDSIEDPEMGIIMGLLQLIPVPQ